ncbi:MAG: hypothetical protein O8C61_05585 [Candidatus Methanoperedens sp.]|nr:hypothetical protein [Candidatus Methanoperedens sp.]
MSMIYGTSDVMLAAIVIAVLYLLFEILRYIQRKNKKKEKAKDDFKKSISCEIKSDPNLIPDTPFEESGFPLPQGAWYVYAWERLRDGFMRFFYYNKLTVLRLKTEGNADHRTYILKPIQMSTINWDNCTYNVRKHCLVPVRRNFILIVIEGISEPLDLWNWADIMNLIKDAYREKLKAADLDEELKLKIGKFSFDAREFYSKMNNRNIELLAMTSIPNLQVMYYAAIAAAGLGLILVLMMAGWLPSGIASSIADLKVGMIEILKQISKNSGGG